MCMGLPGWRTALHSGRGKNRLQAGKGGAGPASSPPEREPACAVARPSRSTTSGQVPSAGSGQALVVHCHPEKSRSYRDDEGSPQCPRPAPLSCRAGARRHTMGEPHRGGPKIRAGVPYPKCSPNRWSRMKLGNRRLETSRNKSIRPSIPVSRPWTTSPQRSCLYLTQLLRMNIAM
jgi:hypothetical protein